MTRERCVAAAAVAVITWLYLSVPAVGEECGRACERRIRRNSSMEAMSACEGGCGRYLLCLGGGGNTPTPASLPEMPERCLALCNTACEGSYGKNTQLRSACEEGCNSQHRQQDDLGVQYWSHRSQVLDDAAEGMGIVEDKSHNVSLNLEGNIQTDIKSQAFLGPSFKKDDITTKGAKRMEDKSIKFDLQGEIGNDTVSEATMAKHGKGGSVAYGKRGKETSENTSLNIQGLMSHNGSYVDVASLYKPSKKKAGTLPKKDKAGRKSGRSRRRRRRRLNRYKKRRGKSLKGMQPFKVPNKKKLGKNKRVEKLEKVIPKEMKKVVS